ncbi:MAG: peptidase M20, partial [Gammaproteobacteria bacterium]|nr:peptidase M20 [Gammaproteobacteria bacterium]
EGFPPLRQAGNVLRPATSVKVSLRLPPTCNAVAAAQALKQLLQSAPPYDASVTFTPDWSATGWNAPPLAEWLENAIDAASRTYFNQPAVYMGEGGTIPFMAMLGERYPHAQFLITGVLGPGSNAHGPNEFLDIPTAKRLTCCIARVIVDHYRHGREGG